MDKRDLAREFQNRLELLRKRSGVNASAFARGLAIDRSALSQLLSASSTRLPRAETLLRIAQQHNVSLDWLLGLSQDQGLTGQLKPSVEIEEGPGDFDRTLLARWHAEALGSKIRYVPAGIPDFLRTPVVVDYESDAQERDSAAKLDEVRFRIEYNRRPETDMEACMPRQTLELFAAGLGSWSDLPAAARADQIRHMAELVEELYPTFRLYLYDARRHFSAPYTIFGQKRVCIYLGGMYLVLNSEETIRTLTEHFGGLVRGAVVNAHECAHYIRSLKDARSTARSNLPLT